MRETVPRNSRVYGVIEMADDGMARLRLSAAPPVYDNPMAVLIWRGVLPQGNDVVLELVSDPTDNEALRGRPGAAATLTVRSVATGDPGSPVKIVNAGTENGAVLDITIPAGNDGSNPTPAQIASAAAAYLAMNPPAAGKDATAPTIAIGKATTLAAGSAATITNSGTATALKLDFGIPGGAPGPAAATLLGAAVLIDRATLALSAGVRTVTVTGVTGLAAGDAVVLVPTAIPPAGYAITSAIATATGTLVVTLVAPVLAAGTSTSIAVKVYRLTA